ncbi:MAG: bifunctional riboflavin kinase/FMN adenylyltransferase [Bacteroidales bacterium]|nr:bifunctional riboflavin kinase/FMN adenylyltransferase [Bacteroidales bacterium]
MAVVTTGFFDGVHLGHRHVLETVVSAARSRGEEAVVVTFWPHPRTVLQQDARDFRLLSSMEEKKELLHACGIDRVEVLPFDRSFAAMTAAEYLALLRDRFGASLVVMGYDNRIGSDMKTALELEGYGVPNPSSLPTPLRSVGPLPNPSNSSDPTCHSERSEESPVISSTQIRKALGEGRVEDANAMLGYKYGLYGVVVSGNRMGRTIGFPTANMQLYEPLKLVPANGVYAVEVEVLGRTLKGMCNIGVRPTVDGKVRTIETHILSFDQDIYGLPLRLRFLRRIRDERRFPSLEDLRRQLILDRDACSR